MTAKVANDKRGHESVIGKEAIGKCNDNGNQVVKYCELKELTRSGNIFKNRNILEEQ